MTSKEKPGEFDLIARYFAPLAAAERGAFSLLDDAAALAPPPEGRELVVTTDAMVEGVHFPAGIPPGDIAAKLLRVNLSDLAAMGAEPSRYTVAAALPHSITESWVAGFAQGLAADQEHFGVVLAGGDTVSTPGPLTLTLTALGSVEEGRALRRGGAKPGDRVWVSGTLGDAALGLLALKGDLPDVVAEDRDALVARLNRPEPRIALGRRLVQDGLATAAADVSDGLVADLIHICKASGGINAVVEEHLLPRSTPVKQALAGRPDLSTLVLAGGDDYELLFTTPPEATPRLKALAGDLNLALTAIGSITESPSGMPPVRVVGQNGTDRTPEEGGWRHF